MRAGLGALLAVVLLSCSPKGVQSPVEKAPPAEIEQARTLVARGDPVGARKAYERFMISHPGTAQADLARLELGILEAASVGCDRAVPHFLQVMDSSDRALSLRGSLRYAVCQLDAHQPDEALETLLPLTRERFAQPEDAMLRKTAVEASEQSLDAPLALAVLDALLEAGTPAPEPERVDAVIDVLAMKLSIEQAALVFEELVPVGAPQLAVAERLLEHALETQDAVWISRSSEALRDSPAMENPDVRMLVVRADEFLHGNPYAVGVLLPLTGRGREVGRQLLEGMQLAALHGGGPELIVEDTAGDPATVTNAAGSLVRDRRVVAVLGPVGVRTIAAAAEATESAGVPLLTFTAAEAAVDTGEQVFRFLYSPREELRALVTKARAQGAEDYVILYPDHGYGRTLRRIFDEEVAAVGGHACPGVAYPPGTRSFAEFVQTLLREGCDVVLLADVAQKVASIAPTFAAEGAWSTPDLRVPEHAESAIRFLLPSPSWSQTLLSRASRYLQGALVVVPFYGESETPDTVYFNEAYQERYGRLPQTFAAYGYDAYRMVADRLRQGYSTRQALSEALRGGSDAIGVTAIDAFSTERVPALDPPVYEVRGALLELQE